MSDEENIVESSPAAPQAPQGQASAGAPQEQRRQYNNNYNNNYNNANRDRDGNREGNREGNGNYNTGNNGTGGNMRRRRKVCQFCVNKTQDIDYKDTATLRRFISERSKILPRRTTGVCASHQRQLMEAIKRARVVALIPYVTE